jgi:ribonuclease G
LKTEILISCDEWENRVAVLEEGSLAEIYFEREEKVIGSIYKGRVENVLPGMGACFVNIGLARNAFLYVDDILRDPINIGETEITDRRKGHTVNELLKVGSEVLVQVIKEPRGLKGARVSTNISLPGRYLVLMPTGRYSGVSSRIEDPNERARLKQIMRRVRPEGMATIVRTAAAGASEAELIADLGVQLRLWHSILESYKRATAPALLHKDLNLVFKAVRDFLTSDVTAVYIDSREQYEEIRSTMALLGPQYLDRLKLVEGPGTLFEQRNIDVELQKLLRPKIPLPSGGHLVLEHTEALTVIDVNTGKFTGGRNLEDTIVRTNIEAAAEVARQVRLRDIGGIIVVDFIDMAHERSREQVIATLTEALRRDRTRSTIQMFSKLGLLEFTRKRVGRDLAGQLRSDCPYCSGLGTVMSSETVAIGVLRQIRDRLSKNGSPIKRLDVVVDPGVATQLVGWYHDEFLKLARDHNAEVALFVDPHRHREQALVEEARRMRVAPAPSSVIETELLNVRLPNPASGVAEVNGYLVEVKDAANAAGQRVKIRVERVEGNLVHASLAEPLAGVARRRRERGAIRGVSAGEAPIAPPAPLPAQVASAAADARNGAAPARTSGAGLRHISDIAFPIDEDEDVVPPTPAAGRSSPRPAAPARPTGRKEMSGGGRRRRQRDQGEPPPLVVGGEGEIDYDDGEDLELAPPAEASHSVERAPEPAGTSPARKRRRRRGRGQRRLVETGAEAAPPSRVAGRDEDEDEETVIARGEELAGDDFDEVEDDTDLGAVVDPRQRSGAPVGEAKRFGPIRQLYGRPIVPASHDRDEGHQRSQRPQPPAARQRQTSQPVRDRRRSDEDDLDVVVRPAAPGKVHVEPVSRLPARQRPAEVPARREGHIGRGDRLDRRGGPADREPRERRRPERAGGARPSVKREGPAVRQLYPPPDVTMETAESADAHDEEPSAPKPGFGRQPRGPLMRPPDAAPVPKGKVRQLYPPPEEEEIEETREGHETRDAEDARSEAVVQPQTATTAHDGGGRQSAAAPEPDTDLPADVGFAVEVDSSLFVSDARELEERRRRARERAEARRRAQELEASLNAQGEPGGLPAGEAPNGENDEWPVF